MKKVLAILILFLSCYFIYQKTIDNKVYYLVVGDYLSKGVNEYNNKLYGYNDNVIKYLKKEKKLKESNNLFTNSDYRIIDINKILEYNEKKEGQSLNYLIKKADIITISLGMNELTYKLQNNPQNIYTYIDNMLLNYDKILSYINSFHHQEVFIIGYYPNISKYQDIYSYANYNLKKLCKKYNFTYVDISNILSNKENYIRNENYIIPNLKGHEKISQIIVEKIKNN